MSSHPNPKKASGHARRPAFDRTAAQQIAGRRMYTASGEPIYNLDNYLAAGGQAYNSAGQMIQNPRAYRNAIEGSLRQNTTDPKYLYHYTTDTAAASIAESGSIMESPSGLAGAGTYLTAKPPRTRTDALLENNYGSATSRNASYVNQYARVAADNLSATHVGSDRDVWLVNGDVDLSSHNGFVARRRGKTDKGRGDDSASYSGFAASGYMGGDHGYDEDDDGYDSDY